MATEMDAAIARAVEEYKAALKGQIKTNNIDEILEEQVRGKFQATLEQCRKLRLAGKAYPPLERLAKSFYIAGLSHETEVRLAKLVVARLSTP